MKFNERITSNPGICYGRVCIKGTGIMVSVILDNLSEGLTIDEIIEANPPLNREDIFAAISYGAELVKNKTAPCNFDKLS